MASWLGVGEGDGVGVSREHVCPSTSMTDRPSPRSTLSVGQRSIAIAIIIDAQLTGRSTGGKLAGDVPRMPEGRAS